MERSVYAYMTGFSLAPPCDGFPAFLGSYLSARLSASGCRVFPVNVWRDSTVQGNVRGVRERAPNRGGINEDNMSHIFGSGAGTGNEAGLVWVTAAHVLVCHCPVSLCVKLADIDTCSP